MPAGEFEPPSADYGALRESLAQAVAEEGRDRFLERARIAPSSLQTLLGRSVAGELRFEFPWLLKGQQTTRKARAWARTLTRVVEAIGKGNPFEWCSAAGLGDSAGVRDAVLAEQQEIQRRKGLQAADLDLFSRAEQRRDQLKPNDPVAVAVGLVANEPFCTERSTSSFFHSLGTRLIGAVNPGWTMQATVSASIEHVIDGLLRTPPTFDFAVGLFDTVHRRFRGLEFIPIPGWQIRVSAVCVDAEPRPSWADIGDPEGASKFYSIVIREEAGYLYLHGPCGYPEKTMRVVDAMGDPRVLADTFATALRNRPAESTVLIVADEETCRQALIELNQPERVAARDGSRVIEIVPASSDADQTSPSDSPDPRPRYDLCIALREGDARGLMLLREALNTELLGNAYAATARLYASVIAAGLSLPDPTRDRYRASGLGNHTRTTWKPAWFLLPRPDLTTPFWRTVLNTLQDQMLAERMRAKARELADGGVTPQAIRSEAEQELEQLLPKREYVREETDGARRQLQDGSQVEKEGAR